MVHRGKPITEGEGRTYRNPLTDEHEVKKYRWKCGTCGTEYYYQNEAVECEVSHRPKPKLETYAEYRARLNKENIAHNEYIANNQELRKKQLDEINTLCDSDSFEDKEEGLKRLKDHFDFWRKRSIDKTCVRCGTTDTFDLRKINAKPEYVCRKCWNKYGYGIDSTPFQEASS